MGGNLDRASRQEAASFSPRWLDGKVLVRALIIGLSAGMLAFFFLDPYVTGSQEMKLPGDVKKAIHLMELFGHGLGVLLVVWLLALMGERRWRQLAVAVVLTSVVGAILKMTFLRQRPSTLEAGEVSGVQLGLFAKTNPQDTVDPLAGLVQDSLHSFPSGHATTAFALATALALLYPRARVLFFGVGGLVCLQRVFASSHYFSDVIAGATIGFVLCRLLMDWMKHRSQEQPVLLKIFDEQDESGESQKSLPGKRRAA